MLALSAAFTIALVALVLYRRSLRPAAPTVVSARPTRFDALRVRAEHPRVWLDPDRVKWLRAKVAGQTTEEVTAAAGDTVAGLALASVATGDSAPCRAAFAKRGTGGPSYHVALLYDWCHAQLSAGERAELRRLIVPRMEADMKNGRLWRSFHNAGHTAAFTLAIDALALQGDDPIADRALAFLRPELEDMLLTFDNVFPDGEWAEGADYARHASQHGLRTLLAYKSATGIDLLASSPHLKNVAKYILYATKPAGLMFPGDDNDYPYLSGWEHMALLMSVSEYRDEHAQWFLRHCQEERFQLQPRDRWAELLWRDDTIPERPLDDLPLARLFRGKGIVFARSGWKAGDPQQAWLAFTNGDYFGDHDHYDVNAFQISRGSSDLAIDSGRYDDDWASARKPSEIARSQFFNYYQRTIAHNTMLVYDPNESFGPGFVNDGGQLRLLSRGLHRNVPEDYAQGSFPSDEGIGVSDWTTNVGRWERGDITAYLGTKDFTFVRGDGTRAYSKKKVSAFVRDLVFVRPRLVVVFDRVVAVNPSFQKTWLLHTIDEPSLATDGSWFEAKDGGGRLFGVALLPEARALRKVGGAGEEFSVDGVQLRAGPQSSLNPSELHYGERPGAWRIEERPAAASVEDHFANVMLLTDAASQERPRIEILVNDAATLAFRVREGDAAATFRFAKGATSAASLTLERDGQALFAGVLPDHVVP